MVDLKNVEPLTWAYLYKALLVESRKCKKVYPVDSVCIEYIDKMNIRSPSCRWPYSYGKALLTKKFARWCSINAPDFFDDHFLKEDQ